MKFILSTAFLLFLPLLSFAEDEPAPAPAVPANSDIPIQAIPVEHSPVVVDPVNNFTSTSFSKQFIVYGRDATLCSALSAKADEIRKNLLSLLKIDDKWKYPIVIRLFGAPGDPTPTNPIRNELQLTGNAPTFIINIHTGRGINLDALNFSVVTMLISEMTLRDLDVDAISEDTKFLPLPPWLLYGIEQALLWKNDEVDRSAYASLFERDEILTPDQILSQQNPSEELDATSFAAYKASCGALTLCLLSQKGGELAMKKVLGEAIFGSDDPIHLIKRNFPLLTLTPSSLHKWWTLQLSTMATPPMTESLSIQDSERRLKETLVVMKFDPESRTSTPTSLDNLDNALASNNIREQLATVSGNLVYLGNRCFPTYRPIIAEYSKIIAEILVGKTQRTSLQKRVDSLVELRALSVKAAIRARDYMDWYEISNRSKLSNTFDSYINTMQSLRKPEKKEDSHMGRYLDDIEKLYLLPNGAPTPAMEENL